MLLCYNREHARPHMKIKRAADDYFPTRFSPYIRTDARGTFIEIINGDDAWRSINWGKMKKGAVMGNHYHKKNTAFFSILQGEARVEVWKKGKKKQSYCIRSNQGIFFMPYDIHTVTFLKPSSYLLLKKNKFNESAKDIFAE